jgi:Ca2+-dependent lipid-binding protein
MKTFHSNKSVNTLMYGSGTIYIRPQNARLFRDTDIIGAMEPYVRVTIGYQSQYTRRAVGKTPVWSYENLPFHHNPADLWIVIEVFDHDAVGKDDLVGGGCYGVQSLVQLGRVSQPIPIYFRERPVGDVMVDMEFVPSGSGAGYGPPGGSSAYPGAYPPPPPPTYSPYRY